MKLRVALLVLCLFMVGRLASSQTTGSPPRVISLHEAVELALKHNHVVRLAALDVDEHEHTKQVARSAYFPSVRNDTNVVHVSDTQLIEIPAGAFGSIGGNLIPADRLIISDQGGRSFASNGTGVVQPLTQLLKIKAANDVARAAVDAARGKARGTENEIALKVHQLYYQILVAEARRSAVAAKIQASEGLQSERVQQVKYGSALEAELIESRAQSLQAKQELLTTELQLSDLHIAFNDAIGLPLGTDVTLDPTVTVVPDSCAREECIKLALASHPEVEEARATVEKAESAVRLARYEYLPDVQAYVRYNFQNRVPFLPEHFATVGIQASYEVFDGGRKRALLAARYSQLAQAKENLARISEEVEVRVHTAYNKLERTRQMVGVSEELLALRGESRRVAAEQLTRGAALRSLALTSLAQELDAKAQLLQSRLDYVQATAEMDEAIGRTP